MAEVGILGHKSPWRIIGWVLGIPAGIFLAVFLYSLVAYSVDTPIPTTERVHNQCQEQFGIQGKEFVTACEIAVLSKVSADRQQQRLDNAMKGVR